MRYKQRELKTMSDIRSISIAIINLMTYGELSYEMETKTGNIAN